MGDGFRMNSIYICSQAYILHPFEYLQNYLEFEPRCVSLTMSFGHHLLLLRAFSPGDDVYYYEILSTWDYVNFGDTKLGYVINDHLVEVKMGVRTS